MKLAVMQPYFFPYLGYWQLIDAVDEFVLFDDVNFIKKGFINRNNILIQGAAKRFNLELSKASQNKYINEIDIGSNHGEILKKTYHAYKNAPFFEPVYALVEQILAYEEDNLAKFLGNSIETVSQYLGIDTKFHYSSDIPKNQELKAQDKIIDICLKTGASTYVNLPGGRDLYKPDVFIKNNLKLKFIHPKQFEYVQFGNPFVPNLSIIDVMMFCGSQQLTGALTGYELIP